jgi:hypothetical protein
VARGESKGIHESRPMEKSISMRVKDKEHFDSAGDSIPKEKYFSDGTSHKWRKSSGPGKFGGQLGHITSNPNEESVEGPGAV